MTALISLALLVAAASMVPPQFEITTMKKEDQVTVAVANDKAIVDIHSRSGIGSATITLEVGEWTHTVVLRLHLGGMERFAVSDGKATLSGSAARYGEDARRLQVRVGDEEKEVEKDSPYWTDIKIMGAGGKPSTDYPPKDGYFEIVVPTALLRDKPMIRTSGPTSVRMQADKSVFDVSTSMTYTLPEC